MTSNNFFAYLQSCDRIKTTNQLIDLYLMTGECNKSSAHFRLSYSRYPQESKYDNAYGVSECLTRFIFLSIGNITR